MPSPPVINNKESEIKGCSVNLTWSLPPRQACPVRKYIIYFRIKTSEENEANWREIRISQVTKTFEVIPLICDLKYEIAMASLTGISEGDRSTYWQVKTNSGVLFLLLFFYTELVIISREMKSMWILE